MSAESIIINTGKPVMALGGFSGSDIALPSLPLLRPEPRLPGICTKGEGLAASMLQFRL